jgi:dTDP-4-amino-4,6-dideoxygalactose transaminase
MTVRFLDLGRLHESIRPELDEAFDRVLKSSSFVGGREVAEFEDAFAAIHAAAAATGCGSGTDALALTLRAMGIGPGDEVIVPSMTFVATAEAVVHVGATPVVADVDPVTLLLDEPSVQRARTAQTRAVIAVHLYGHTVPFQRLERWRDDGLLVIEDAAQAVLARDDDRPVGSIGHAACFSFYPGKNLGALGDGGMVLSSDTDLVSEIARLRDHGRTTKYEHEIPGYCSRLDGLQAALLAVKLRYLPEWTAGRQRVAARYHAQIGDQLVPWTEGAVHHLLVTRSSDRDRLAERLSDDDIASGIHYPIPLSRQPWLVAAGAAACPAAEQAAAEILSLPMDPYLTDREVDDVCAVVAGARV